MPGRAVSAAGHSGGDGAGPGFHGKVPARGDFVTRRLPRSFLDPWDGWLQEAVGRSREQLGEAWLPAYLTCPVWRFVLGAGLCGPSVSAGVMMPSVDRVGRYFPLALVALLPGRGNPAELPAVAGGWFDAMEALALSALEDGFDLDGFDADLAALGPPPCAGRAAPAADAVEPVPPLTEGWRVAIAAPDPTTAYPGVLDRLLRAASPGYSLWWTVRSERVEPSLLICAGLPRTAGYAAFLDGSWERWGWAAQSPMVVGTGAPTGGGEGAMP